MADETSMALEELLRKAQLSEAVDCLREGVRALAHALMEAEVRPHVGARRDERTSERTGERKGSRERRWDTRVGSLTRRVPRVRDGSSFPAVLEPRRRAERALVGVVRVGGCRRRMRGASRPGAWMNWCVDELVRALGLTGISKSRSRRCARNWTRRSSAFGRARWARRPLRTSGSTPPSSKRGRRGGW